MSDITKKTLADLPSAPLRMELIRSKAGVHVFRCEYEGRPSVVKYFEREGDRREIEHYRLLTALGVPTMRVYALCTECIVMEDISASGEWRLGEEGDMNSPSVMRALAGWYFALHESGENIPQLSGLYSESDQLTEEAIGRLREKLPGTKEAADFAEERIHNLRALLGRRENTLTYNDFYYTNLLVRKDGAAAMMFDYNLMGRGCRYGDFRNVESSVSEEAFAAFCKEYSALYRLKHGRELAIDPLDRQLDGFLSPLLALISAIQRERFPAWARDSLREAESGELLLKGKELFKDA